MLVYRSCAIMGKVQEMELPIDQERLNKYLRGEGKVQDIFPELTPDQREFLITGLLPEQWAEIFASGDIDPQTEPPPEL